MSRKPRPYVLSEATWKEISATQYEVAILPWGATEAHNYRLPYGTDVFECDYFAAEFEQLAALEGQGLVELEPGAIQATPVGWYFVRALAMLFDRHLQTDRTRERFSRII